MSWNRMFRAAVLALGLALAAPIVSVEAAPAAGELVLPKKQEITLKGGFKVLMLERHDLPLVTMQLTVRGGSAADPAGKEGLANFTAEMLRTGAGTRNAEAIARAVDAMGAELGHKVDRDSTQIVLEALSRDVGNAVSLLSDLVIRPTFPDAEFERVRRQLLADIQDVKDNPSAAANFAFIDHLYRGHPYGHPEIGYEKSVTSLTKADLQKFHAGVYRPENAYLVVIGDFKSAELRRQLTKSFEDWPKKVSGAQPLKVELPAVPAPIDGQKLVLVHRPELTQVQIRIGNLGYAAGEPAETALAVANTALGGGFTSRLNEEIRVNRSLSYGANSRWAAWKQPGPFIVTTFTKNETVGETLKVALDVVKGFKKDGMKEEELNKARALTMGNFAQGIQTPEALAAWLTKAHLYNLPVDYVTKYGARAKAVQPDQVKQVLTRFPTDNVLIVLYADKDKIADQLKGYNVTVVDSIEFKK